MWRHAFHSAHSHMDSVKDYALAGTLISLPAWVPQLTDINAWLTFAGLVVGLVLGIRRLIRDFQGNH